MKIRHRNRLERWPDVRQPEWLLIALGILGLVLGIVLLLAGLVLFFLLPGAAVWLVTLGLVCAADGTMGVQTSMAEFTFSSSGVQVKYPLEKLRFYPWEDFQQVCICYYSRATEMSGYPLICLVRNGEKTDRFGRWKTGSVFHYRKLLCLDYFDEQLQEIRRFCPLDILDLRDKGNYRL